MEYKTSFSTLAGALGPPPPDPMHYLPNAHQHPASEQESNSEVGFPGSSAAQPLLQYDDNVSSSQIHDGIQHSQTAIIQFNHFAGPDGTQAALPAAPTFPQAPLPQHNRDLGTESLAPNADLQRRRRPSLLEIRKHVRYVPDTPTRLEWLAEFRRQRNEEAIDLIWELYSRRVEELDLLKRHRLEDAGRHTSSTDPGGLRPWERLIIDGDGRCTYCGGKINYPVTHFFSHILTEIRSGLPFPPRSCILFTRERLDQAFQLWRQPIFRCPQCFKEFMRPGFVKTHLERACEFLQGDLIDVRRWIRSRPRSHTAAVTLLRSFGYPAIP